MMTERRDSGYDGQRKVEPILPGQGAPSSQARPPRYQGSHPSRPSLFWPIILISAGVLLLLSNMGVLPDAAWGRLWQLWPVALIALGIDVLFGRRSAVGAFIGAVLILMLVIGVILIVFFGQYVPGLVDMTTPALDSDFITYPTQGVETARVSIDWNQFPGTLEALDDSNNLIEADVDYIGDLIFDADVDRGRATVRLDTYNRGWNMDFTSWREKRWMVRLNPDVPLDLTLDASSGRYVFDLSELTLSRLTVDASSGAIDLSLPQGNFDVEIDGSSGALDLTIPKNLGVRIDLERGSGAFNPDRRFDLVEGDRDDDSVWETENYGAADYNITIVMDQASGMINIHD
jgi:hypothetical protein